MFLRPSAYPLQFFLLFLVPFVQAQNNFDCKPTVGKVKYDLTALAGEHTVSRTRETPPSTMVDELRFNLCGDLKRRDDVKENDQCPDGTRACLIKTNKKADEPDRIVAVIPSAQTSTLRPELTASSSPKGLSIILHGGDYPSMGSPRPQSLSIILLCSASDAQGKPTLKDYDGERVTVEWSVPASCGTENEGDRKEEKVGSGLGWFFLVFLLAVAAYFGLGAYHNYATYGATGADLIPHRDFWKEVPYMLKDVISHLCSTVRPRHHNTRSGYIAV